MIYLADLAVPILLFTAFLFYRAVVWSIRVKIWTVTFGAASALGLCVAAAGWIVWAIQHL